MKTIALLFLYSFIFMFCSYGQELSQFGLLDVTADPFFADPTGVQDCTEKLQNAIDYAQKNHMVVYFPSGIYRISNTLECRLSPPPKDERGEFKLGRYWGITLLGSTSGTNRPKIYLAPNSPNYDDVDQPKLVLYFHMGARDPYPSVYPDFGPSFMNSRLIGVDIEIGEGNSGAVAVRMRGAQGMAIEDVTIDVSNGLKGIEGANGSGAGNTNVTIIGGRIGFDGSASQPTPSITGFTFIDQTEHAILYRGRQTLCATGIKVMSKYPIVAVKAEDLWTKNQTYIDQLNGLNNINLAAWNGPVNFVDCEIQFTGAAGTAFESNCGVYLSNCYVKNAHTLVNHISGDQTSGQIGEWTHIQEYASGYDMRVFEDLKYTSPLYIDQIKQSENVIKIETGVTPPVDLLSRHVWDQNFPSWQSAGAVNVKSAPYNAVGDGIIDDTDAIQSAINNNEIVFIPAGLYRVSKTIDLKSNTKLIGLMPNITGLVVRKAEGDFSNPANPQPILRTPDDADAEIVIAFLGTWTRSITTAYNLLWRAGRKSLIRNWMIMFDNMRTMDHTQPSVIVTGNGGGRWYNYYDETWFRDFTPSYRHLYINGTEEPFRIYQCNPEHTRSEANMEICNAKNVTLYGIKCEANSPALLINNSENIRVFGYGGNATPMPFTSVFKIESSKNILLTNLFNNPRFDEGNPNHYAGLTIVPTLWHMIIECSSNGIEFRSSPLERPVLYKNGETRDIW